MEDKLWNCIKQRDTNYIPIWFMRQAGRYLPEFRKIRKKNTNFIKLCLNKKLAAEITLQPLKRFDLDAAIIFSDILIVPYGLGQDVKFKKNFGPILGSVDFNNLINLNSINFIKKINPVYEAIKKIKKKIKKKTLIGFVGAPWTLLLYMLHKKSPKNGFIFRDLFEDKLFVKRLLVKLEEVICLHIDKQVEAGATTIQVFDSWAGLLPKKELGSYCYVPTLKIVEHIKSLKIPAICFPKGISDSNVVDYCTVVKPDCISLDYEVNALKVKNQLKGLPIQGGPHPKILLGDKENIKKSVEYYLDIFSDYPYIFNLGHGILPSTDPKMIDYVIKIVRDKKK